MKFWEEVAYFPLIQHEPQRERRVQVLRVYSLPQELVC
jgi:hypothetical protein